MIAQCEGKEVETSVQKDTLDPVFNAQMMFYVKRPDRAELVLQVLIHCCNNQCIVIHAHACKGSILKPHLNLAWWKYKLAKFCTHTDILTY